jgi:hypothetical protein
MADRATYRSAFELNELTCAEYPRSTVFHLFNLQCINSQIISIFVYSLVQSHMYTTFLRLFSVIADLPSKNYGNNFILFSAFT